jgi:DNA repair exonuclease SbcCD ATPase subunit
MNNLRVKILDKNTTITSEISELDSRLKEILDKNISILEEDVRNYAQLRKRIKEELRTEKIITRFEHLIKKSFVELQKYFQKAINESKQIKRKELYQKYENEISQLIEQELKTFEQIKKEIEEWDEKIENIKQDWLKEIKKGNESKRDLVEYRKLAIHETNTTLYNRIKELLTVISRLKEFNDKLKDQLGTIKETKIEIKIPKEELRGHVIILDTNFFKAISDEIKKTRLVIAKENLRGHNIIIPRKVVVEATSTQNEYNKQLVPRTIVSNISRTIGARILNLEYKPTDLEERKLRDAWAAMPQNKRKSFDNFKRTADAEILIYIWRNPKLNIAIITNDGDFNNWKEYDLLGNVDIIPANETFRRVAS